MGGSPGGLAGNITATAATECTEADCPMIGCFRLFSPFRLPLHIPTDIIASWRVRMAGPAHMGDFRHAI
jgi:hypothetical protein